MHTETPTGGDLSGGFGNEVLNPSSLGGLHATRGSLSAASRNNSSHP
jgi:hypothetical protein